MIEQWKGRLSTGDDDDDLLYKLHRNIFFTFSLKSCGMQIMQSRLVQIGFSRYAVGSGRKVLWGAEFDSLQQVVTAAS